MIYDIVIVGAGINGCSSAYFLTQAGQRILLIDQEGIAAGGSGAAGAFISPKFTKGGYLKEVLEEAYCFSLNFYTQHFPEAIQRAKLLQIANSEENALRLSEFKTGTTLSFSTECSEVESILTPYALKTESLVLEQGGVVNAQKMCESLADGIDFVCEKVEKLVRHDGYWQVGSVKAKKVVLATGSYDFVIEMPYMALRRVWGHRIDVQTTTTVPFSIHHHLSVSPSSKEGVVAIGATHNLHFNPFSDVVYDVEAGRKELLEKAALSVKLEDVKVIKDYTGLRSGSNDYLPMVGGVVDASSLEDEGFNRAKLKQMKEDDFRHFEELYMLNGSGGYGFVLAPYLAKQLSEHLVEGKALNEALLPSRFFRRWAKRQS